MRLENDELLIDNDGMLLDRNATNIYIYIYIHIICVWGDCHLV